MTIQDVYAHKLAQQTSTPLPSAAADPNTPKGRATATAPSRQCNPSDQSTHSVDLASVTPDEKSDSSLNRHATQHSLRSATHSSLSSRASHLSTVSDTQSKLSSSTSPTPTQTRHLTTETILSVAQKLKRKHALTHPVSFSKTIEPTLLEHPLQLEPTLPRPNKGKQSKKSGPKLNPQDFPTLSFPLRTFLSQCSGQRVTIKGTSAEKIAKGELSANKHNQPLTTHFSDIDFALPMTSVSPDKIIKKVAYALKQQSASLKKYDDKTVFHAYTHAINDQIKGGFKFTLRTPAHHIPLDFLFYDQLTADFDSLTASATLTIDLQNKKASLNRQINKPAEEWLRKKGFIWFNESIDNGLQRVHKHFSKQRLMLLQPEITTSLYQKSDPEQAAKSLLHLFLDSHFAQPDEPLWQVLLDYLDHELGHETQNNEPQNNESQNNKTGAISAMTAFKEQLDDWQRHHPNIQELRQWISFALSSQTDLLEILKAPALQAQLIPVACKQYPIISLEKLLTCWQECEAANNSIIPLFLLPATDYYLSLLESDTPPADSLLNASSSAANTDHSESTTVESEQRHNYELLTYYLHRFDKNPLSALSTLSQLAGSDYKPNWIVKRAAPLAEGLLRTSPQDQAHVLELCRAIPFKQQQQLVLTQAIVDTNDSGNTNDSVDTPDSAESHLRSNNPMRTLTLQHETQQMLTTCQQRIQPGYIEKNLYTQLVDTLTSLRSHLHTFQQQLNSEQVTAQLPWPIHLPCTAFSQEVSGKYLFSHWESKDQSLFYCGPTKHGKPAHSGVTLFYSNERSPFNTSTLDKKARARTNNSGSDKSSIENAIENVIEHSQAALTASTATACLAIGPFKNDTAVEGKLYFSPQSYYQGTTVNQKADGKGIYHCPTNLLPPLAKSIIQKFCYQNRALQGQTLPIIGTFQMGTVASGIVNLPTVKEGFKERLQIHFTQGDVDRFQINHYGGVGEETNLYFSIKNGQIDTHSVTMITYLPDPQNPSQKREAYKVIGQFDPQTRTMTGQGKIFADDYQYEGSIFSGAAEGRGTFTFRSGSQIYSLAKNGRPFDPLLEAFDGAMRKGNIYKKLPTEHIFQRPHDIPFNLDYATFSKYNESQGLVGLWMNERTYGRIFSTTQVNRLPAESGFYFQGDLVHFDKALFDSLEEALPVPNLTVSAKKAEMERRKEVSVYFVAHRIGQENYAKHPHFLGINLSDNASPVKQSLPFQRHTQIFSTPNTPFYPEKENTHAIFYLGGEDLADYLGEVSFVPSPDNQEMLVVPHGEGLMYLNGVTKGRFNEGKLDGQVKIFFHDGTRCSAKFNQGELISATTFCVSGFVHQANFKGLQLHGPSTLIFENNEQVTIDFSANRMQSVYKNGARVMQARQLADLASLYHVNASLLYIVPNHVSCIHRYAAERQLT